MFGNHQIQSPHSALGKIFLMKKKKKTSRVNEQIQQSCRYKIGMQQ
jgi:hypothetical protein